MTQRRPIRVGIMGFGQTGRQIYQLAAASDDLEVVAIADIGKPEILHYLLCSEGSDPEQHRLEGNFLVNHRFRARLMEIDRPAEMPWDIFGVDMVIDSTGKYRDRRYMEDHLGNGTPRVLLRTLPTDGIDRIVIPGINEQSATANDRMISAGSATTSALALLFDSLAGHFEIECGSMTTVHAFTSDQALQDYAGSDFRRSRSAAKNIIPNSHEAALWLGNILPQFDGKILTSALNVPVQEGCLLDVNLVLGDASVDADAVNEVMRAAAAAKPGIIGVAEDPIVSSDVIGSPLSLLFDAKGTIKAGNNTIKTLSWYENLGHASRLLDVVRLYATLDAQKEAA
ncbi:glyceraldehyde-3-phosphate dehydrogenase [Halioglobus japonicus]|uniref:Glyceraldehyde-3-phosphate dehydrogenase n=1 Tax=Halioglobus japonicus TaxID=930805 RepID=A0AAP8MEQ1_9GAMM|nr:glyceraldehyde 3-phosphate dehydrogenase NAD-binding domain-containing protein [Halioglobus japonicus]AQA18413.1 glyceraldehyde-3-phosphate dehydrogenase [Halioglobus japonicus]PLW86428.1 glyceraldehyde-3-phosphate dehydrogenase [Halioglobus japonicus]GHD12910.1 glyceraldehyde-3-phosphate dehydrogenase [Halioglobus japonicus]